MARLAQSDFNVAFSSVMKFLGKTRACIGWLWLLRAEMSVARWRRPPCHEDDGRHVHERNNTPRGSLGASMSVRGPSSSQMGYCKGYHWRNTGTHDGAKMEMIGLVNGASNPLPSSKLFSGFQRAAERDANCVSVLTFSTESRNPCLGKIWTFLLRISFFFNPHPSG